MEYQGKEKSPYYGVWQSSLLLIMAPTLLTLILWVVINAFKPIGKDENIYTAFMFGFGVGFIFQFTCAIAGLFKGTFKIVWDRTKEFFSNLSISVKFAFKYYFENLKEYGIVFWIYFDILALTLAVTVYFVIKFISIM